MNREQRELKREYKERWKQVSISIEAALSEVAEMMKITFDAIGTPEPDSGLDQAGLEDGEKIVREYLKYNEYELALEHLCYMIEAADLPISPYTFDLIASAGKTMKMSPNFWIVFDPSDSLEN